MFFRRKEAEIDNKTIVSAMLSSMMNDQLLVPVYINDMKTEADAEQLGIVPVVYVWNENRAVGSFSISVNGKAVGHLLEVLVPRSHSKFAPIRDEVMAVVSQVSQETVVSTCRKMGGFPSEIFRGVSLQA